MQEQNPQHQQTCKEGPTKKCNTHQHSTKLLAYGTHVLKMMDRPAIKGQLMLWLLQPKA
jgi:hypothetical protein